MSSPQDTTAGAQEILDSMLGHLGFATQIEVEESGGMPTLQVFTNDSDLLIGENGERLNDIQYLVNRLVHAKYDLTDRVRVDVEHHRTMKEEKFIQSVQDHADQVRSTGKPVTLRPMNAYFRRLVHHTFRDDPEIKTESEKSREKSKRIRLSKRS